MVFYQMPPNIISDNATNVNVLKICKFYGQIDRKGEHSHIQEV